MLEKILKKQQIVAEDRLTKFLITKKASYDDQMQQELKELLNQCYEFTHRKDAIDTNAFMFFTAALQTNETVKELTLKEVLSYDASKPEKERQIYYLIKALAVNTGLQMVDISYNQFDEEVVIALSKALQANKTLQTLKLGKLNLIGPKGLEALTDLLNANHTITIELEGFRPLEGQAEGQIFLISHCRLDGYKNSTDPTIQSATKLWSLLSTRTSQKIAKFQDAMPAPSKEKTQPSESLSKAMETGVIQENKSSPLESKGDGVKAEANNSSKKLQKTNASPIEQRSIMPMPSSSLPKNGVFQQTARGEQGNGFGLD